MKNTIIVVCGPTASGKTAFAHNLAKKNNGEIVNCDAMQIYKQLPILTSSPEMNLTTELPYHLYNFLDISNEFSVIKYINIATQVVENIISRNQTPVIVGGSGMYINALLYGYNELPSIDHNIREETRTLYNTIGKEAFFDKLQKLDSLATSKLNMNDTQRILRAYEVFIQSEKSICSIHYNKKILPLENFAFKVFYLNPDRQLLYENCDKRLIEMFQSGAIDEVKTILEHYSSSNSSGMKAIGLNEIIMYLNNIISLSEAITLAQAKTRQYAKRQITWFKNQLLKNHMDNVTIINS